MTKKLYSFDDHPEHREQLKPWADKWVANALSTVPMSDTDRSIVHDAVLELYASARLEAPRAVVFCASPMSGTIAAGIAAGIWYLREHPEKHRELFGRSLSEAELIAAIRPGAEFCVRAATRYHETLQIAAPPQIRTAVATVATAVAAVRTADATVRTTADAADAVAAVRTATATATAAVAATAVRTAADAAATAVRTAATAAADDADAATATAVRTADATATADLQLVRFLALCVGRSWWMRDLGNQWVWRLMYLSFFRQVAQLEIDWSKWLPYEVCAEHSGPRYMHTRFSIVCDRFETLKLDEQNRPHCTDGPSHRWRDGWELHHWHGTRVAKRVIENPESLTAEELRGEQNTEVFRAIAERLGWARTLEKLGAKAVNSWIDPKTGLEYSLHVADIGGEEARFVRKQSSVTKQNEQPIYLEPVPSLIETAQAARKWQAMAAFLDDGDERGGLELARHCNKNPQLEYAWEA